MKLGIFIIPILHLAKYIETIYNKCIGTRYLELGIMSVQLTLDLGIVAKKRIRYDVPNYLNFYSLYQYDRDKFRELLREWLQTDEGKNRTLETLQAKQDEILEECFIRDMRGNKLKDSDEKHIYRYRTLFDIQRAIYDKIQWEFINSGSIFIVDDVNLHYEDKTAEIKGTEWGMSIKDRVILHIKLLRLLRKGFSILECIDIIKKGI